MDRLKLVMVGNGMAGVRTLEELLRLVPDLYDITVFGAEPHPNYNRILLSPVLAGERTFDDIVLNGLDWYAGHGIDLRLGRKVVSIDRKRRVVLADDGSSAHYDRLILATGSTPVILSIPGNRLGGVIAYHDIADTEKMLEITRRHSHAVVIGGGLLGLEAANALRQRGMDVTVAHLADWLLERQLGQAASKRLQQALEARGIRFRLGEQTEELLDHGTGRVCAVQFEGGDSIAADLVVMATGIRPNTGLAEKAGIPCNHGIQVDDTLQTFDPRIYAVGECVSHRGIACGLVAPLFEQARVCANHLAMLGTARYRGTASGDTPAHFDPVGSLYRKLALEGDAPLGGGLYDDSGFSAASA